VIIEPARFIPSWPLNPASRRHKQLGDRDQIRLSTLAASPPLS
jgi:hypothetical protein